MEQDDKMSMLSCGLLYFSHQDSGQSTHCIQSIQCHAGFTTTKLWSLIFALILQNCANQNAVFIEYNVLIGYFLVEVKTRPQHFYDGEVRGAFNIVAARLSYVEKSY